MTYRTAPIASALSALTLGAGLILSPASAQIPNAPGTPIGTPLGSPGAVQAPQMAQPVPPPPGATAPDTIDPPGRVGRISDVSGEAWLYSPDSGEWVAAERNRPLTTGDRLATDDGARVEVRVGSTTLRLDGGSEIEVERLDDGKLALRLHNGSLATRVRSDEIVREFELLTGEGRFTVQRTGRYRFDRSDEASHVTVYAGQAMYEGTGSALTVHAGQRAEFWLDNRNVPQYSLTDPVSDAFASWNSDRDRADDRYAAQRYVSPEMTGVEDLDRYGSWQQNPEYGALWVPRTVSAGWAPYTTGRWVWVSPWGWTWVDEAPWGFAPFHYGRWVNVSNVWCWAPGTYVRRPVYAPALVAWIGGPRLSVSLSIGGAPAPAVGWVPLAPREVYVPYYRVSPRYVRNVNVTHVTNITNITTIVNNPQAAVGRQDFRNRKFPHAVTVVPADVLAQRRPVAPIAQQLRDRPDVRRFATEPSRVVAVAAPPVAAPPAIVRRAEQGPGGPRGEAIPAPPGRTRAIVGRPNPGDRPNLGDRPNIENRPGADNRPNGEPGRAAAPAPIVRPNPPAAAVVPPRPNAGERPPQGLPPGRAQAIESAREARDAQRTRDAQQARETQQARDAAQAQQAQRARELQAERAQQQQAQQAQRAQQVQLQQAQQAQQARAADEQRRAAQIQQQQRQQQERARAVQEQQQERARAVQEQPQRRSRDDVVQQMRQQRQEGERPQRGRGD